MDTFKVPIEVSARHIHCSPEHVAVLFGENSALTTLRTISQPGQSACNETVTIIGPKGELSSVRVIAPPRKHTQLELSITDCHKLGIEAPIAVSGDIENSVGGVTIVGPKGSVELDKGVIIAQRHLHVSVKQARELGLKHMDTVSIEIAGKRSVTFHNVVVRSRQGIDELSFMLDTDEANAAGIRHGATGILLLDSVRHAA